MNLVCILKGHDVELVADGKKQKVAYQKGDKRPAIIYFTGRVYKCRRKDCSYERYEGPTRPTGMELI